MGCQVHQVVRNSERLQVRERFLPQADWERPTRLIESCAAYMNTYQELELENKDDERLAYIFFQLLHMYVCICMYWYNIL